MEEVQQISVARFLNGLGSSHNATGKLESAGISRAHDLLSE
jgi:hypothetical protein